MKDERVLLKLWKHEGTRVIADRYNTILNTSKVKILIRFLICFVLPFSAYSPLHPPSPQLFDIPRFTNPEDSIWFDKAQKQIIEQELGPELALAVEDNDYFVSFLRYGPSSVCVLCNFLYFCA